MKKDGTSNGNFITINGIELTCKLVYINNNFKCGLDSDGRQLYKSHINIALLDKDNNIYISETNNNCETGTSAALYNFQKLDIMTDVSYFDSNFIKKILI